MHRKPNPCHSRATSPSNQCAIPTFRRFLEKNPEDAVIYSNRSATHLSLKHYKEALADADKCLELDPGFVKGYGRRAAALLGLKK